MRQLKRAGFFRELRHGNPAGPSLTVSRSGLRKEDREAMLHYLRSASILWATPCLFDDALEPSRQGIDDLAIATDGEWAWPTDLPYYVETYNVALPDEFVEHMQANHWQPPSLTDEDLAHLV